MQKIGVIIQARTGSKRLPNKMLKSFSGNQSLLEVVLKNFQNLKLPVFVATSTQPLDDEIEKRLQNTSISVFRGSEDNVLSRFVACAEKHNLDVIVRVCADNPFISVDYIDDLIKAYQETPKDYLSFQTSEGTPAIRTHYGFFAELVALKALKKAAEKTKELHYLEHVTNFIYEHPEIFSSRFLPIPFQENKSVRLTVDTIEDFKICQEVYAKVLNKYAQTTPKNVMDYLLNHPEYLTLMHKQIDTQKK